jgi:hypothetical protein
MKRMNEKCTLFKRELIAFSNENSSLFQMKIHRFFNREFIAFSNEDLSLFQMRTHRFFEWKEQMRETCFFERELIAFLNENSLLIHMKINWSMKQIILLLKLLSFAKKSMKNRLNIIVEEDKALSHSVIVGISSDTFFQPDPIRRTKPRTQS